MRKLMISMILVLLIMAVVVPSVSAAPPDAPPASGGYWYRVKYGDTLYGISRYTGVSTQALINANGIKYPDWIYAGQYLWVPAVDYHPSPPYYGTYHTVQYGQTLSGIAAYYGVNAWSIARANHIYNLNQIYAGQVLYIP